MVLVTAKYSENLVSDSYKTRTFECSIQMECSEEEAELYSFYLKLYQKCVKNVRKSIRRYINAMKDDSILVGGKKKQWTKMTIREI